MADDQFFTDKLGTHVRTVVAEAAVLPQGVRPALITIDDDGRIGSVTELEAVTRAQREHADLVVAGDLTLMPGGVDTHVHLNEPGRTQWEGFATGTRAAAAGGVTTVVDMPLNSIPPTVSVDALETKRRAARGQLTVDTGFWGGATPSSLGQLESLWHAGVAGFKCFTADSGVPEFPPLDSDQLVTAMREIAAFNGLLIVHAEAPEHLVAEPAASSRFLDFVASRPERAEVEAIRTVVEGVRRTGCRTHILHLSAAAALDLVADAKDEGLPLTVETCPHYLTLDAETVPDAAPQFKCCPPVRDAGNQEALWEALGLGVIDVVVSDHSPATAAEKSAGGGDLMRAWGGISGLQVGLSLTVSAALSRGLTLEDVSRWTARGPADLAGMSDRGRLTPGASADFAVWDPTHEWTVEVNRLEHKNPISAYDGMPLRGAPVLTILRGAVTSVRDREGAVLTPRPGGREILLRH
ncbi:allantoinase AllB [Kocuria sp. JC486]|uniref:allantoinase AllB n=1 Tax=Kocuria sp. JC486 TaxID=1970736 RepID=UPI001424670F|nr:allantoinase AllB [Kocuria sp. JC486]NHU86045.1 allantoinase AllB [Kocuria sp. JC486]